MVAADDMFPVKVWSTGVRWNPRVRRAARNVAWALVDCDAFATTGCNWTNTEIAAQSGLAAGTVKNALSMLVAQGHIACVTCTTRDGDARTIHPVFMAAPRAAEDLDQGDAVPPLVVDWEEPFEVPPLITTDDAATCPPEEVHPIPEPAPLGDEAPTACDCMTVTEAGPEPVPGPGEADPPAVEEARGKVKVPVSQWSRRRQIAQAGKLVRELPWLGKWRCQDGWCGAEASYICADEGKLSCRLDRGTLNAPVALARFGLGPLSPGGGLDDYGDFHGRSAR